MKLVAPAWTSSWITTWTLAVAGLTGACGGSNRFTVAPGGSELTDVSIALPDRGGLKTQVADIETKMNAYRLVVKPVDDACANATRLDQIGDYVTNVKLNASLSQGCDYDITLELGQKRAAPDVGNSGEPVVGYEGGVKALLDRACVSCHTPNSAKGHLGSYADAKTSGARIIARAVTERTMPQSGPLSEADQKLLQDWAKGGFVEKAPETTTPPADPTLAAVYYKNEAAMRVAKTEIQGKTEYKAKIVLDLTQAGRDLGLGN